MTRFHAATAVRRVADGRYQADLDGDFAFAEALNGGYLMAVMLRAAVDASPHDHPIATSANYLRVAKAGPAEIVVEPRRTGRTVASSRVTLLQDGRPAVDLQVTTGTLDADVAPDWSGEPHRRLPPVDECLTFDSGRRAGPQFADQVDMRFDPELMGWLDGKPSGRLEAGAYFRLPDGADPDPFVLAMAVDALPPVALNAGGKGWAPTVELTWHLRALPAPGWLALIGSGRLLSGGWFDEEVEVWDSAGKLVAQSRQIARLGRT
jgi:acyl-coenzyme A thioesterase PaaI-like protein